MNAPFIACPYCGAAATFSATSEHLYGRRRDFGPVWQCQPCMAWVGCHPGGDRPLGRLANAQLRKAKQHAHACFDPLWKAKMKRDGCKQHEARAAGYAWLSKQLGIPPDQCHIGMFDVQTCDRVAEICQRRSGAA